MEFLKTILVFIVENKELIIAVTAIGGAAYKTWQSSTRAGLNKMLVEGIENENQEQPKTPKDIIRNELDNVPDRIKLELLRTLDRTGIKHDRNVILNKLKKQKGKNDANR